MLIRSFVACNLLFYISFELYARHMQFIYRMGGVLLQSGMTYGLLLSSAIATARIPIKTEILQFNVKNAVSRLSRGAM